MPAAFYESDDDVFRKPLAEEELYAPKKPEPGGQGLNMKVGGLNATDFFEEHREGEGTDIKPRTSDRSSHSALRSSPAFSASSSASSSSSGRPFDVPETTSNTRRKPFDDVRGNNNTRRQPSRRPFDVDEDRPSRARKPFDIDDDDQSAYAEVQKPTSSYQNWRAPGNTSGKGGFLARTNDNSSPARRRKEEAERPLEVHPGKGSWMTGESTYNEATGRVDKARWGPSRRSLSHLDEQLAWENALGKRFGKGLREPTRLNRELDLVDEDNLESGDNPEEEPDLPPQQRRYSRDASRLPRRVMVLTDEGGEKNAK